MAFSIADTQKTQLRRHVRNILTALPDNRSEKDAAICQNIHKLVDDIMPMSLAAFIPIRKEPDTHDFLTQWLKTHCCLFLPRYIEHQDSYEMVPVHNLDADLTVGHFNIPEPAHSIAGVCPPFKSDRIALWFIPAIAFDLHGHRLGRGNGFYDRLLQDADGIKVGLAYDCQIVDAVPHNSHDISMDYVVTESHIRLVTGN